MEIAATRDRGWMRQCEAALLADGISVRWAMTPEGTALLDIPTSDGERAGELLAAQLGEEIERLRRLPAPLSTTPIWLQPAFALALGLSALLVAFFAATGGAQHASGWYRAGALVAELVRTGEWWRLVTAATLHADAGHALGNAGFLVVLGWGLAERFGGGVMLWVALVTAVLGFVVSLLGSDASVTVGASGGLYGLLGAAAGHGLRRPDNPQPRRRQVLRAFGAAVMLLALTAFSPRANIHAHLGGFVSGLALGLALPGGLRQSAAVQVALGLATALVVVVSWSVALAPR